MLYDPIVDEVRAARQAHAERFGYDLKRIAEDLRQQREKLGWPVASFPLKPPVERRPKR
jgi:hypothetical protein